ncbi:hypothetical protein GPALN_012420 [Globodera pallida]|nr:hypothetical protein GPALN_012420 [Globodera pallida]
MSSACPFHANCRVMPSLLDELMPSSTGGPSSGVVASGTASLTFAAHSADQHPSGGGGGYTRRLTSPLRAFGRRLRQQSTKVDESGDADAADGAIRTPKRASSIYTTAAVNDELEQQQQPRRPKLATRIQWSHDLTVVAPRDEACLLDANGVERVRQKLARIQWSEDLTAVPPPSGDKTEPEAEQAADEPQHLQVEAAVHDEEDEEEEEDLPLPFHPLEEALLQAPEASKNGSTRMSKSRSLQEMLRHYWGMGRHHAPAAASVAGPEQSSTTNGGIGTLAWKESQRRRSRRAALSGTCAIGMPRARSTDERLFAALATHTQQLGLPPLLSLRSSQSNMFQATVKSARDMLQKCARHAKAAKSASATCKRLIKRGGGTKMRQMRTRVTCKIDDIYCVTQSACGAMVRSRTLYTKSMRGMCQQRPQPKVLNNAHFSGRPGAV